MSEIHMHLLMVLEEFDRICQKMDIQYSICYGTMLGAVRHQGFIPWDDDVDVILARDDYERFLTESHEYIDQDFFLQTFNTEDSYYFPFAKLRHNLSHYPEPATAHLDINHGAWVDIFPYDKAPEDYRKRKIFFKRLDFYNKIIHSLTLLRVNAEDKDLKRTAKKLIIKSRKYIPEKLIDFLFLRRDHIIKSFNKKESDVLVMGAYSHTSFQSFNESVIYRHEFDNKKEYMFEELEVIGFTDYHNILTRQYGDYMTLPPIEERIPNHVTVSGRKEKEDV